jgi:hypothetical protein
MINYFEDEHLGERVERVIYSQHCAVHFSAKNQSHLPFTSKDVSSKAEKRRNWITPKGRVDPFNIPGYGKTFEGVDGKETPTPSPILRAGYECCLVIFTNLGVYILDDEINSR